MRLWQLLLMFCGFMFVSSGLAADPDDMLVYNQVTPEKLEKIFDGLKIDFKKVPSKKDGVDYYDLKYKTLTFRLHNYQGQDLWLESLFSEKLDLEALNRWNTKAKYSRAVLLKGEKGNTISLESQLDCIGGVTDPIIRQFINRFSTELANFIPFSTKK